MSHRCFRKVPPSPCVGKGPAFPGAQPSQGTALKDCLSVFRGWPLQKKRSLVDNGCFLGWYSYGWYIRNDDWFRFPFEFQNPPQFPRLASARTMGWQCSSSLNDYVTSQWLGTFIFILGGAPKIIHLLLVWNFMEFPPMDGMDLKTFTETTATAPLWCLCDPQCCDSPQHQQMPRVQKGWAPQPITIEQGDDIYGCFRK